MDEPQDKTPSNPTDPVEPQDRAVEPSTTVSLPSQPKSNDLISQFRLLSRKIGPAKLVLSAVLVILAVTGLVVANILVQQQQLIAPKAFSGANVNTQRILEKVKEAPSNMDVVLDKTNEAQVKKVFKQLTEKYVGQGDTETQQIDEVSVRVKGAAYLKYEPIIQRTFVWARVENLPAPNNKVVHLWITKDGTRYSNAGTVVFVQENSELIAYSVFTHPDDLRGYKQVVWSYDLSTEKTQPGDIVLTVNF